MSHLHDRIIPHVRFYKRDLDRVFYEKCKDLADMDVTAEQLGGSHDYPIPLTAAVSLISFFIFHYF